jgi:large subunit ribosomal protein L29
MKAEELREMSDEQLGLTLKDACEGLFRLRIQAQTERLDAPSELRKHRRLVAQIKTVQRQRALNVERISTREGNERKE